MTARHTCFSKSWISDGSPMADKKRRCLASGVVRDLRSVYTGCQSLRVDIDNTALRFGATLSGHLACCSRQKQKELNRPRALTRTPAASERSRRLTVQSSITGMLPACLLVERRTCGRMIYSYVSVFHTSTILSTSRLHAQRHHVSASLHPLRDISESTRNLPG